jgi:integrase
MGQDREAVGLTRDPLLAVGPVHKGLGGLLDLRQALATGLRRGELLGLQWGDIDLEERTVRVSRQVLVRPRSTLGVPKCFLRDTTKSRRVRLVRFDQATATVLRGWKAAQGRERLAFGPAWRAGGGVGQEAAWVVTEPDGTVIHPDTPSDRWTRLAVAAGVPSIPLHGARRSTRPWPWRRGSDWT